ncbi:MAG: PQQ-binding-like beta-propeller repeat protein [Vicinamibacterales bacterium]|jgi:quinoprotein glucose dehydrogenase|nr:PQQ-binding-like beta-propeller repeat protein [Vicinamibacterales bacterium]HJO18167.1 PQQ-binding-like beta-propeller repeat protein [Vicinamibacterales bacterium]|tara:strand:- start:14366 stop:16408 length:2043 start_codon:yes stop_codon:yes gene_type:complete
MRFHSIRRRQVYIAFALATLVAWHTPAVAQDGNNPYGEWRYQSADSWGTRYSPIDQVNSENFEDLEIAWLWRGDNFGPVPASTSRSTPTYVDGILYSVAGERRTVVALDPSTGETLWTYREPNTTRWERSMRASYGKGVGYDEINGRGVIYLVTPAFFLHAIDAKTGLHVENWGEAVPLPGFPETGVVDLLPHLIGDWDPWLNWDQPYDPDFGIPAELGYITSSSPPIVVNGVVVVGNSAEQGYTQSRIENVPGDILGYNAQSGEFMWKFHIIPRPGESGHETWLNDAWQYTGDISSWAPLSADNERGIVYIPTNPPTIDYFGGFRPGENLYGTSTIALDVQTGERKWHFQTVHNDQWNYDLPNVPIIANLTVDGREIPAVIQNSKQGMIFAFNRETGEPIWPIEERDVPESVVPGNWTSPTQPYPTKPAPVETLGLPDDRVIDFTPELKAEALEIMSRYNIGDPYMPKLHVGHDTGVVANVACSGGVNITHPVSMDPTTGIMYVSSSMGCSAGLVAPGIDSDDADDPFTTGTTVADWVRGPGGRLNGPQGLPIFKPPYSRLTAVDMNSGEHLWWVPTGETPNPVKNHPALQNVDLSKTGGGGPAISMVMGDLVVMTDGRQGDSVLHAVNKRTGDRLGTVEIPSNGQYGMMTYLHDGKQFVVVQIGGSQYPSSLVALALP